MGKGRERWTKAMTNTQPKSKSKRAKLTEVMATKPQQTRMKVADQKPTNSFLRLMKQEGLGKAIKFYIYAVDGRTQRARRIQSIYQHYLMDLGGPDNVSVAEAQLLKSASVLSVLQEDLAMMWLNEVDTTKQGEEVLPWALWLDSMVLVINVLQRTLKAVGLQRRAKKVSGHQALQQYIEQNPVADPDDLEDQDEG